jgi:hypothetical protein
MTNSTHPSGNQAKKRRFDATGCFFTLLLGAIILFLLGLLLNWFDLTQILPAPIVPNMRVFPPEVGEFVANEGAEVGTGTIFLSGQGEPNELVTIMQGEQLFATAIVNKNGEWEVTKVVTMPAGRVDLVAQTFTAEGEIQGRSNTFSFKIPEAIALVEPTSTPKPSATPPNTPTPLPPTATPTALPPTATPIPTPEPSVKTVLADAGIFSTFLALTDQTDTLDQENITLFPPTDAVFAQLPSELMEGLMADPNSMAAFVEQYVVSAPVLWEDGEILVSNAGISLTLHISDTQTTLNNIPLADPLTAPNGTIYPLGNFLLTSDSPRPTIDSSGVASFVGDFLTVVGTAQPDQTILLALNNTLFGTATADSEGNWQISNNINAGIYTLIAYTINQQNLLQNYSNPVELTVTNSQ